MRQSSAALLRLRRAVTCSLHGAGLIQPLGSVMEGFCLTALGAQILSHRVLTTPRDPASAVPAILCELLGGWVHWPSPTLWDISPEWVGALNTTPLLEEGAALLSRHRAEAAGEGPSWDREEQLRAEVAALRAEAEELRAEGAQLRAQIEELRSAAPSPPFLRLPALAAIRAEAARAEGPRGEVFGYPVPSASPGARTLPGPRLDGGGPLPGQCLLPGLAEGPAEEEEGEEKGEGPSPPHAHSWAWGGPPAGYRGTR